MKSGFSAVLFTFLIGTSVQAEELICDDPVDNEARIGFPPGEDVVFYEDPNGKACRFSINGWSAGSPPREMLLSARDQIRNTLPEFVKTKGQMGDDLAQAIAIYLAAASPFKEGDARLTQSPYSDAVEECIASYPDPDGQAFRPYQNSDVALDGFWCATIDPRRGGALDSLNELLSIGVTNGVRVTELTAPYIVIRNDREGGREYLFLALPEV